MNIPESFAKKHPRLLDTKVTSFPRRRESMLEINKRLNKNNFLESKLDSRLRGNDVGMEIHIA